MLLLHSIKERSTPKYTNKPYIHSNHCHSWKQTYTLLILFQGQETMSCCPFHGYAGLSAFPCALKKTKGKTSLWVVVLLEAQGGFTACSVPVEPDEGTATYISHNTNKYDRNDNIFRSIVICVKTSPCEMDSLLSPFTGLAGTTAEIDFNSGDWRVV